MKVIKKIKDETFTYSLMGSSKVTHLHIDNHQDKQNAVMVPVEKINEIFTEWVSVDDQLPEFDVPVLVAFDTLVKSKQYTTARYVNLKYCAHHDRRSPTWYVLVSGGHVLRTVTHWQTLPAPPEQSND